MGACKTLVVEKDEFEIKQYITVNPTCWYKVYNDNSCGEYIVVYGTVCRPYFKEDTFTFEGCKFVKFGNGLYHSDVPERVWVPDYPKLIEHYVFPAGFYEAGIVQTVMDYLIIKYLNFV